MPAEMDGSSSPRSPSSAAESQLSSLISPKFREKRWNFGAPTRQRSVPAVSFSPGSAAHSDEGFVLTQKQVADMKAEVSRNSRENFELERRVRQFDTRIGLLIGLRINNDKEDVERLDIRKISVAGRRGTVGERRSSWPTEEQFQHYGNLFFLLQTKPHYLARLARQVGIQKIDHLLQVIMFTLYGHHYDPREEHLLLCMFEHALMLEFEQAADVNSVLRQNTAITRMMTSYTRRGPGQEYLRQVLTAPIVFLSSLEDNLEINPVEIFRELMQKGKATDELADTTFDELEQQAEASERVRRLSEIRAKRLEEVLETLLSSIFRSASTVPFGIRWLCRTIRTFVHRLFPNSKDTAVSLVGGFFFLRYINPTIIAPQVCHIISSSPSREARRTLTLVAKVIQKIANLTSVSKVKEAYMSHFDGFIAGYQQRLKDFLNELCDVEPFHDCMQVEHFMAFSKNSVTLELELSDLHALHTLLAMHSEKLAFSAQDRLNEVLQDLGPVPSGVLTGSSKACVRLMSRWNMGDEASKVLGESFNDAFLESDGGASAPRDPQLYIPRCVSLLMRLLRMLPEFHRSLPVPDILVRASESSIQEVKDVGSVCGILVEALTQHRIFVDELPQYREMKMSIPGQGDLYLKYCGELMYLFRIKALITEHSQFLNEQLDTYKLYLSAVRKQAVDTRLRSRPPARRQASGASCQLVRVTVVSLVRESVVTACPSSRHADHVEVASPSPGHYVFSLIRRRSSSQSSSPAQDSLTNSSIEVQLEDLLELRLNSNPTFVLANNVTLNADAIVHWLQKNMR